MDWQLGKLTQSKQPNGPFSVLQGGFDLFFALFLQFSNHGLFETHAFDALDLGEDIGRGCDTRLDLLVPRSP